MADLFTPKFGFAEVDGVARARDRGIEPRLNPSGYKVEEIGPLAEFLHHAESDEPSIPTWLDADSLDRFFGALSVSGATSHSAGSGRAWLRGSELSNEEMITTFQQHAHLSAKKAGFASNSPFIAGALGELIGNVVDHSNAVETGKALLLAKNGQIELVVSDRGIGALSSLRTCELFESLSSEGEALTKMIEKGVSRFGQDSSHGFGFRPIFEKLANMTGYLRFRSGDYALTLDGRFGDKVSLQLAQKPRLPGFFVNVVCRLEKKRADRVA
ncbi:hypothetical protein T8S45_14175 [Blastomonas marina]|uniref:hypothetical protein n=1 Tax=Blastomonas marina TaxID=1867408 RepID=UPI002AC8FBE4|nr:hypothetical protein [Blastomonas marina]WPZ03952.1 hypothetical protein T8S45_14175 [Blastomonas marina]